MNRVLLARNELYVSGNSLSISIPPDTLENTPFERGDPANIFSVVEDDEIVLTADTRRWLDAGARARGSRKIRVTSHGSILVTMPPEALVHDMGFDDVDDAKGAEVRLTIDPVTTDLVLEFED